jgi:anti-sigma factor RsiW
MTDDLHHLAAAYALDALDPAEREAFEVHYPTCGLCLSEVIELQETAALLAGASAVAPPPELRSAVLAGIARTRQVPPAVSGQYTVTGQTRSRNGARSRLASRFPTRLLAMAAAIAIVAGVAGGIWATVATDGGRGVTPADVAAAGDAITTDLLGVGQTDLRVIWSPGLQQAVVVGSGLATAGSNQTYALWAAEEGGSGWIDAWSYRDGSVA